jgi:hypothetical protein
MRCEKQDSLNWSGKLRQPEFPMRCEKQDSLNWSGKLRQPEFPMRCEKQDSLNSSGKQDSLNLSDSLNLTIGGVLAHSSWWLLS